MSNQIIPVIVLTMNPMTDQRIALILMAPQTVLMPATKEFITDTAWGGAWVNSTPRQVSCTGVYGSTPGDIHNSVSVEHAPYPFLIRINGTYPNCVLKMILQVVNKRHYSFPGLVRQPQKLDAIIERKLPDLCPFSVRLFVTNSSTVILGTSTRAVI